MIACTWITVTRRVHIVRNCYNATYCIVLEFSHQHTHTRAHNWDIAHTPAAHTYVRAHTYLTILQMNTVMLHCLWIIIINRTLETNFNTYMYAHKPVIGYESSILFGIFDAGRVLFFSSILFRFFRFWLSVLISSYIFLLFNSSGAKKKHFLKWSHSVIEYILWCVQNDV